MTIGNFHLYLNTTSTNNPRFRNDEVRNNPIENVPYWRVYQVYITPNGKERVPIGTATFEEWHTHFEVMTAQGDHQPSKTYFEAYPRMTDEPLKPARHKVLTEEHFRKCKAKLAKMLEALK